MKSSVIKSSRLFGKLLMVGAGLIAIVFQTLVAPPVAAQTQESQKDSGDVRQLKDKLQKLEQTVAPPVAAQTQVSRKDSGDVQQLKDKLQKLEQTVEELKTQLAAVEKAANQPATPSGPSADASNQNLVGSTRTNSNVKPSKVSVGESTMDIYGFAMLDMGFQFNQNDPLWFDVVRPTKLPAFPDEFAPNGKVFAGVRQTRFGVKTETPTDYGALKTKFEFELFGVGVDAGQTTFRLRHAYGELGHFGAGQTWSPFMDPDVFPNEIEYWGPTGMVFFRNVQLRWMPLQGDNAVTIALERPGASGDQGVFTDRIELQGIRPKFDLPDLSANARFTRDWGHFQISGMLRRIRWVDKTDDQFDLGGTAVGWGINTSSNVKFGPNNLGRFQVVYGEGIENYMNDAPVDIGVEPTHSSDPRRPIKGTALPVLGVVAFLDHTWSKRFTTSVGYSLENISNSESQAPDAFHRGHYGIANLLFYPTENVMMGGEFQWGRRENFSDGFSSNDYRVQFSFRYNFSKSFGGK